jgi:hypothetical protein
MFDFYQTTQLAIHEILDDNAKEYSQDSCPMEQFRVLLCISRADLGSDFACARVAYLHRSANQLFCFSLVVRLDNLATS